MSSRQASLSCWDRSILFVTDLKRFQPKINDHLRQYSSLGTSRCGSSVQCGRYNDWDQRTCKTLAGRISSMLVQRRDAGPTLRKFWATVFRTVLHDDECVSGSIVYLLSERIKESSTLNISSPHKVNIVGIIILFFSLIFLL